MGQTDLQKKDELRRELRILEDVNLSLNEIENLTIQQSFTDKIVSNRIEDIKKALEED